MQSEVPHVAKSPTIPQVVLVHGTFAGDANDTGTRWWQRKSDFYEKLQTELRGEASLVADRELFRWLQDGNREILRLRAADDLLRYIEKFELEGTPYHLVGHSHGGSVIWEALKLSFRGKVSFSRGSSSNTDIPLKNLLSWTTVGTPFIHRNLNRRRWIASGLVAVVALFTLGAATLFGAIMAFVFLRTNHTFWEQVQFFLPFLLAGWMIYIVLSGFVTSYDDGRTLRREAALGGVVFSAYGDKWYGIWSYDDEAINGLRGAAHLRANVFTVGPLERSPFVGRLWWYLVFPAIWITRAVATGLAPLVNGLVSDLLRRKAMGDERPAPKAFEVSPAPFPVKVDDLALEETIAARLRSLSDAALGRNAPQLRSLLKEIASDPGSGFAEHAAHLKLPDATLIHTSYFLESGVRQLILAHIALSQESRSLAAALPQHSLAQVAKFKERLSQARQTFVSQAPAVLTRILVVTPTWVVILVGIAVGTLFAGYVINEVIDAIVNAVAAGTGVLGK